MNKKSQWFNPLAVLTFASLGWAVPAVANEAYSAASVDYFRGQQSIPIEVETPAVEENPRGNFGNFGSPVYQGVCPANFDSIVRRIIGPDAKSRWGILVESLQDGTVLYSHNGDRTFIPASNNKIFTTAAALQRFSADTPIKSNVSLQKWVMVTNKRSHNGYADTLMRYMGGPGAAKATLAQLGVNPSSFRIADGSGLSRSNVSTPRALVDTLRAMYSSPQGQL
ncbi:MAG: D-alanyl-D-alanine carboxypeptidase, partial [Microcystaceae cyanobacterium]